jgi:hypothetical protein
LESPVSPAEAKEIRKVTTMETQLAGGRAASRGAMGVLTVALTWPIISLLITGTWHFAMEAIWPDLRNFFVPAVLGPILLTYGAWTGYRSVSAGGSFITAIVSGAILGLLPLMLQVVGFGLLLNRGLDVGLLAGVFGFSMVLFGALIGGGVGNSGMPVRAR